MTPELTVLVLLVLGLAFMALEAFVPSFGLLGLAGAASFISAIIMLRNFDSFMGLTVDGPLMGALGIIGVVVLIASLYFVRMAWKLRAKAGSEAMIGMAAKVLDWNQGRGQVHVDGEDWAAQGPDNLQAGDSVKVIARDHLILTVTKD